MRRKNSARSQMAGLFAVVLAGAVATSQAQTSKIIVKNVTDPLPQAPGSTLVVTNVSSPVLQAQGVPELQMTPVEQQAGVSGAHSTSIRVSPGRLLQLPAGNGLGRIRTLIVGDEGIVAATPLNETSVILRGVKPGRTDLMIIGGQGTEHYHVDVDALPYPDYKRVEIYNGQKLSNWTGYYCGAFFTDKSTCGEAEYHEVRKEDLPKGYSSYGYSGLPGTPTGSPSGGGAGYPPPAPPQ